MLTLAFIRHAEFEEKPREQITQKGAQTLSATASRLRDEFGIIPQRMFASILPRGLQSAAILTGIFEPVSRGLAAEPDHNLAMGAQGGPRFLREVLGTLPARDHTVICVSHLEAIGGATEVLTGQRRMLNNADSMILRFDAAEWGQIGHPSEMKNVFPNC